MDGRRYGRHTTTLLVDHRDGQRRGCLEGNPFYEGATRPGVCAIAGEKKAGKRERDLKGGGNEL